MILEKVFTTVDTHVLGETYRIVTQSPIQFTGTNINENDEFLQNNYAIEKKLILNEPRGHRGINGCIVLPSTKADYQLLFFNHEGVSCFQYEGLFASLTALLETGNISRTKDNLYK